MLIETGCPGAVGGYRSRISLDDRAAIAHVRTAGAFHWFLDLRLEDPQLRHPSCTYVRHRLGREDFEPLFHGLLAPARAQGLVSDRLRFLDAAHRYCAAADFSRAALVAGKRSGRTA